jgi:ATP-dependent helicase HepA
LEEIEYRAMTALFDEGPFALAALAKEIEHRIIEERRSQDEQYALDRIALAEEPIEAYLQALESAEEDEQALETAVDRWLIGALQFRKRPFSWPQEDPFKLDLNPNTLVPRSPWLTEFKVDVTLPLTWRRHVATKQPEATLLRPGTPLIDVIERFSRWDDRGTAFVTWRVAREWGAEPWIGFRLCFVVEPNIEISDLLAPTHQDLARVRRAQRYFQPLYRVMHVDVNGDPVLDQSLLAILEKPYDGNERSAIARDLNLGSRLHLLEEIIDSASFQGCCRSARDIAHATLSDLPDIKARIDIAGRSARADIFRYRNRMARRSSSGDELAKSDIAMIESILPSVLNPAMRLDAMGCFVIANYSPRSVTHV